MHSTWTGMLLTCSLLFVVHGDDCAGKASCNSEDSSVLLQSTIRDHKVGSGGASGCSMATSGVFQANAQGSAQQMPCSLCQIDFPDRETCDVLYDVPDACAGEAGKTCPLMFMIHGSGGDNTGYASSMGPDIHSTSRSNSFIGVYPNGSIKSDGMSGWNTGAEQIQTCSEGVDDVGFIKGIVEKFKSHFSWTGRAYAYGHSNGAALCQKIAVNGKLGFTGVAPSATQLLSKPMQGGPGVYNYNWPSPDACTVPIAYISFHGALDPLIPYQGNVPPPGSTDGTTDILLSSNPETNKVWSQNNGCGPSPTKTQVSAQAASGSTTAEHWTWPSCGAASPTEHYKIADGKHESALSIEVDGVSKSPSSIAMDFFDNVEQSCKSGATCPGQSSNPSCGNTEGAWCGAACSNSCSAEFSTKCVPFKNAQGKPGYAECRLLIDANDQQMTAQGCVQGCKDTPQMKAAKNGGGR